MSDQDSRTRILLAAGPIFAEKGFAKATVREICRVAQVNLASINYYFGDKQRLYVETVKHARHMRAQEAPLPDWLPGTPPEKKLYDFIHNMLTRLMGLNRASWQVHLLIREIQQPTEACRELVDEYFRPHFNILLGVLKEMLPEQLTDVRLQQIGISIIGQCFFYRSTSQSMAMMIGQHVLDEHYTIDLLADHICQFSLAAIGRGKSLSDADSDHSFTSIREGAAS